MLRGVAAFPAFVPVISGNARVQVVGLDDVAETVARVLAPDAPSKVTWNVANPEVHTLSDIVIALRGWLGFPPRPTLQLPDALGKVIARIADGVGWLGWRSPVRTTSLAQLTSGIVGDPDPWMAATGIQPKSLDQILAARPANVQDRWFARLYLLKPLAIVGLALAAIAPSLEELLTFWRLRPDLYGLSFPSIASDVLPAVASSAITLVAGFGLLVRATARLALIVLLVLKLLYVGDYLFTALRFAVSPAGPLSIDIPIILAILFLLAILDER